MTSPGQAALPGVVSRLQPPAGAPGELRQPCAAQALLRQVGRAVSDPGAGTPAGGFQATAPPPSSGKLPSRSNRYNVASPMPTINKSKGAARGSEIYPPAEPRLSGPRTVPVPVTRGIHPPCSGGNPPQL